MTGTWSCTISPRGFWKAEGHRGHHCSASFVAAWFQPAMEWTFWGQVGFLRAPGKLCGCSASSYTRANQVPARSSPLHCLWLRPCDALLKSSSSTSGLPKSRREAFTAVKCRKAKKPHSLETSVSLLESLTLTMHWNMFKAVVMSKALIPNLMGENNRFGTKFARYINWWVFT